MSDSAEQVSTWNALETYISKNLFTIQFLITIWKVSEVLCSKAKQLRSVVGKTQFSDISDLSHNFYC